MTTHWDGIEDFLAVAEVGSFTQAASQLDISVSVMSRRIAQLERRLGVKLFTRTTRAVRLTPAGFNYLHPCRQLMDGLSRANAAASLQDLTARGSLRVGVLRGFAGDLVGSLISKFLTEYPDIAVEMTIMSRPFDLRSHGFDLAIVSSVPTDNSLQSELLHRRRFCMAASPHYLKKYGIPKDPDELVHHECIRSNDTSWMINEDGRVRALVVSGRFRILNQIDGLILGAVRGLGIVYLSEYYVGPLIRTGVLVPILDDYWIRDMNTWLVHPYQGHPPQALAALLDFLHANLNEPDAQTWRTILARETST